MKTLLSALAIATTLATPSLAAPVISLTYDAHQGEYNQALTNLGYSFTAYDYATSDWSSILSGTDVFLIGEISNLELNTSDATRAAVTSFVQSGGTLVVHYPIGATNGTLAFLNQTFGLSLWLGSSGCTGLNTYYLNEDAAAGTTFEGGHALLPAVSCTAAVKCDALPAEAHNLYSDGRYTSVFALGFGEGQLVVLGWDMCASCVFPLYAVLWHDVLDRAIRFKAKRAEGEAPVRVPEAATVGLLGFGLAGVALASRRRKAA